MKTPNAVKKLIIPEEGLLLEPRRLYLGRTNEFTKTDKYIPMLEGRSSTGRLGLFIHVTAGFGDVGFAGFWTLEIFACSRYGFTRTLRSAKFIIMISMGNTIYTAAENTRTTPAYSPA